MNPYKGEAVRDLIVSAGIEVVDRGPNVKRGNYNVKCPFCGAADPSAHMGIDATTAWWGCWRNSEHRGKSPVRLLIALLSKPVWEIRKLLGLRDGPGLDLFAGLRQRIEARQAEVAESVQAPVLILPAHFRKLPYGQGGERHCAYLTSRGLAGPVLGNACIDYSLHFAVSGEYKDRIIIPYFYQRKLVTWTGRSIYADAGLRYRDLQKENSVVFKNELVYNYDRAAGGGVALLVVEGPFDVLKGDYAGSGIGVHVVGLSTNTLSDAQLFQIAELSEAYEKTYIALDTPTTFNRFDSVRMAATIKGVVDAKALDTSSLGKDFGGASVRSLRNFLEKVHHDAVES